ncbi:adenylyltransferase/cytidyltransferase family protein [Acetobacter sp. UBA5411]|uniref:adenylyltransferase/cytidyltransferase family protein n=1 Tax=Acetobacter sp. UBA5411 TaxID=1945905 RepID=UPI0032E4DE9C
MTTVLTYGTFDLFHIGHVRLLQRASALGERLYVGVSSDAFNALKGKNSIIPYEQRAAIVAAMKEVDGVFPEENWTQKKSDIERLKADILVMGNDWEGKFDDLNTICSVHYLPRTEDISTTDIKKTFEKINRQQIVSLENQLRNARDTLLRNNLL